MNANLKQQAERITCFAMLASLLAGAITVDAADPLAEGFAHPPASAKPWVYWYFMDGNLTREGMTADLEAMKKAGIGGAIFLEVNLGIPRGSGGFHEPAMAGPVRPRHARGGSPGHSDRAGLRARLVRHRRSLD